MLPELTWGLLVTVALILLVIWAIVRLVARRRPSSK
jgi:flagellar biogenesis protein FliO